MKDFFKRNLVWVAILLCIAGIVLSIIGIPTSQPVFFFIGIVLALPTIGYLIYQVFFYRETVELDLAPTSAKFTSSSITSVIDDRTDVLLNDQITNEDDLEPLYDGYANEQEIAKRLHEVTNSERERAVIEMPEIILPSAEPNHAFDNTAAIEDTTNDELHRQRQEAINAPTTFEPEIPDELAETAVNTADTELVEPTVFDNTEPITEFVAAEETDYSEPVTTQLEPQPLSETTVETVSVEELIPTDKIAPTPEYESTTVSEYEPEFEPETTSADPSLNDPNFVPLDKPVMPQNFTPTNAMVIHLNPENAKIRKQKAEEKKALLSQPNLERYLQHYLIETATCFLMDRTVYKDKYGIAPYNKFAVNKVTELPEYTMSCTKGRLYKFCTYILDAERFITHEDLYNDFVAEIEQGIPLARVSETLHPLYRKKYKKDFILNLSNREDWDNVIIIVYNNYILNNSNFKDVFTRVPFEIPVAYNEENVINYLQDPDVQDRFAEKYAHLEELGIPTFWEALYICFINSIKQKLTIEQIESAILRDYKKIARALKRADAARRKLLKKAS